LDQDEFSDLTRFEPLEELYEAFDHEEDSEFDIDDLEREFAEGLESPQLMLVAYTITDDVRRMTRWLRDAHDLKINCVELDYYERDDAEMFVPTIIGTDETQEIKEWGRCRNKRSTGGSSERCSNASRRNSPGSRAGAPAATAG
jgi:hypothetical protein